MRNSIKILTIVFFVLTIVTNLSFSEQDDGLRTARYARIDYDVVYVRCPRATEPVNWKGNDLLNWNGINDMWLSASNNIYMQPGCDLVLHHSDPAYGGALPQGDRGREEVLVDCDENNSATPTCTIADPNVSLDGTIIVYTKFMDTRNFIDGVGLSGDGGWGPTAKHNQSYVKLSENGEAKRFSSELKAYSAPALIFQYDLATKLETQVSPDDKKFSGRAHPGKDPEWSSNIPVMDTAPVFIQEGRIAFTSNRESGFYRFQLFAMDLNGTNRALLGHRALNQQLHPNVLEDGRIAYTNFDAMTQKSSNNNYSLFTINPDGSFPFILAGKHDATALSYHYTTQLSDGDIVTTLYYNHNNGGMGTLLRFPIDPPGADFKHSVYPGQGWRMGNSSGRFKRVGEFRLTPNASSEDSPQKKYSAPNDYWNHPGREVNGRSLRIGTETVSTDKSLITMTGRFTHPSGAPNNDLLVTYTIGASSTMGGYGGSMSSKMETMGKDAGVWFVPLEPDSNRTIDHIVDDAQIVVDFPEYHEIFPRALVSYDRIYGQSRPGLNADGSETEYMQINANLGLQDARLTRGAPYGLSGASSLYDRETRASNGTPWNMLDGGGYMSGRTYLNLAASGADLAIFENKEIYGIRVTLPIPSYPGGYYGGIEKWSGAQAHHLRILGEFPIRKADKNLVDTQGNPDTSFVVKLPADTPFLFQTLDKYGMALDLETTSRTVIRGEQQLCIGCHVHTREGMDPELSSAKQEMDASYGDFSGTTAPLFSGFDAEGNPIVQSATTLYDEEMAPGVNSRRSFAVDWQNGISQIIENRCADCHREGQAAQQLTGLRLDGNSRTFDLLSRNKYTREDGVRISDVTLPGDGLSDVLNNTPGTDRITKRYSCCTDSRWLSFNSARSSMLIWALYGKRLDGRNPETGLPWGASGESIPTEKQGLADVPVDSFAREYPEVWPKVGDHLAYVVDMPESEKRLLARWVDIGAPKLNVHDDMVRPVITVTPVGTSEQIFSILVGLWDDSKLDYASFKATYNGVDITPAVAEGTEVIELTFPTPLRASNANTVALSLEIWDLPNRAFSLFKPGVSASNRSQVTLSGSGMFGIMNNRCKACIKIDLPKVPSGVGLEISKSEQ